MSKRNREVVVDAEEMSSALHTLAKTLKDWGEGLIELSKQVEAWAKFLEKAMKK